MFFSLFLLVSRFCFFSPLGPFGRLLLLLLVFLCQTPSCHFRFLLKSHSLSSFRVPLHVEVTQSFGSHCPIFFSAPRYILTFVVLVYVRGCMPIWIAMYVCLLVPRISALTEQRPCLFHSQFSFSLVKSVYCI